MFRLQEVLAWHQSGWHPLPLPANQKASPPTGWTGETASVKTAQELEQTDWNGNLALRLPTNLECDCGKPDGYVLGIDIDNYDRKTGADQLAKWERTNGVARGAEIVRFSSRPVDPDRGRAFQSGIYLYKVCASVCAPTDLPGRHPAGDHIDFIKPGHRYAVAPGSTHPNGNQYQLFHWRNGAETENLPDAAGLPVLNKAYLEALQTQPEALESVPATTSDQFPLSKPVATVSWVADAIARFATENHITRLVGGLSKCRSQSSHTGYAETYTWDGQSNKGSKAIAGPNTAGRWMIFSGSLSARLGLDAFDGPGSPTWDAVDLAFAWNMRRGPTLAERVDWLADRGYRPANPSVTGANPLSPGGTPAVPATDIWSQSATLQKIHQAAISRFISPFSLLFAVLTRVSAGIPHQWRLPSRVGASSPVSLFTMLVGGPGAGKSSSAIAAQELVVFPQNLLGILDRIAPSSGEGILRAFGVKPVKPDEKQPEIPELENHNMLAEWDEAEVLVVQTRRSGSTLGGFLRSVWSGGPVSTYAGTSDRIRRLPAGQYVVAALVGAHPHHAGQLLADVATGFAARWLTVSTDFASFNIYGQDLDQLDLSQVPAFPSKIQLEGWTPPLLEKPSGWDISVCAEVEDRIIRNRIFRSVNNGASPHPPEIEHGEHTDLMRLRLAACLAYLHNDRSEVTEKYWDLAYHLLVHSAATRSVAKQAADDWAAGARAAQASEQADISRQRKTAIDTPGLALVEDTLTLALKILADSPVTKAQLQKDLTASVSRRKAEKEATTPGRVAADAILAGLERNLFTDSGLHYKLN